MLELTKSNEDYLEAIGLLSEKNGTAQVRDIAEMLKVKMPSVTSAVKQLADMGLVEYTQYAPVKLTPQGRRIAGKIIVSHGILFDFLREELALPEERANEVACQIEHIMTFEEIEKLRSCRIRPLRVERKIPPSSMAPGSLMGSRGYGWPNHIPERGGRAENGDVR